MSKRIKPLGTQVFPSPMSNALQNDSSLLHYRRPPEEPPIDYTIHVKPKVRADYRVVFTPESALPEDFYGAPTHRINDILERAPVEPEPHLRPRMQRRDTEEKHAQQVLHELDSALEQDEAYGFEQMKRKAKKASLNLRQYPPEYDTSAISSEPSDQYDEKLIAGMRRLVKLPDPESFVLSDDARNLKVFQRPIFVRGLSELHRNELEVARRKAKSELQRARQVYTSEFFFDQTPEFERNCKIRTPTWKRQLLAKKMAADALHQLEDRLWTEYQELEFRYQLAYPSSVSSHHSQPSNTARLSTID